MVEAIKFYVRVVLKHILGRDTKFFGVGEQESEEEEDNEEDADETFDTIQDDTLIASGRKASLATFESRLRQQDALERVRKMKLKRKAINRRKSSSFNIDRDNLMDLNGPKLIIGAKNWLFFFKVVGQINWTGKPVYFSMIYKLLVAYYMLNRFFTRFLVKVIDLHVVNENYKNPIFLFIAFLTIITLAAHILVVLRTNLFDLCPMYKILTTPKLCFLRVEVLHILGSKTLTFVLILYIYHGLVFSMMFSKNLEEFINDFRLLDIIQDIFCSTVGIYWSIGLAHLDLYIRSAFGHWLLALRSHLEQRFTLFHKQQRKRQRQAAKLALVSGGSSSTVPSQQHQLQQHQANNGGLNPSSLSNSEVDFINPTIVSCGDPRQAHKHDARLRMVTFDEIQKSLNNMDDHLEVLRTVQGSSIFILTLEAFFVNGMVFLITYHLLADQENFYHGFLFLSISINYIFIFFLCYFGDSWLFYALSAFVQTVEDEYFMQSDIKLGGTNQQRSEGPVLPIANGSQRSISTSSIEHDLSPELVDSQTQQMLLISKKDVLFCREFLHQFENHIATPWSNFTFKSHLHALRTFVTLIAAQIIFEHEH